MASKPQVDIQDIIKLLFGHERALDAIALQLSDQASLLYTLLKKCDRCHDAPYTIEHEATTMQMCDRCAAEAIVHAGKALVKSAITPDTLKLTEHDQVLLSLVKEDLWVDAPNAAMVRTLINFVLLTKEVTAKRLVTVH